MDTLSDIHISQPKSNKADIFFSSFCCIFMDFFFFVMYYSFAFEELMKYYVFRLAIAEKTANGTKISSIASGLKVSLRIIQKPV